MRNSLGISLSQLSEETGISCSYLTRLESGKRKSPSIGVIIRLSEFFGLRIDNFLYGVSGFESSYFEPIAEELVSQSITNENKKFNEYQKQLLVKIIGFIINIDWTNQGMRWERMIDLSLIISEFKNL